MIFLLFQQCVCHLEIFPSLALNSIRVNSSQRQNNGSMDMKVDHQIALPNIRGFDNMGAMDASEKDEDEDEEDERVDVVGNEDDPHTNDGSSHGKKAINGK